MDAPAVWPAGKTPAPRAAKDLERQDPRPSLEGTRRQDPHHYGGCLPQWEAPTVRFLGTAHGGVDRRWCEGPHPAVRPAPTRAPRASALHSRPRSVRVPRRAARSAEKQVHHEQRSSDDQKHERGPHQGVGTRRCPGFGGLCRRPRTGCSLKWVGRKGGRGAPIVEFSVSRTSRWKARVLLGRFVRSPRKVQAGDERFHGGQVRRAGEGPIHCCGRGPRGRSASTAVTAHEPSRGRWVAPRFGAWAAGADDASRTDHRVWCTSPELAYGCCQPHSVHSTRAETGGSSTRVQRGLWSRGRVRTPASAGTACRKASAAARSSRAMTAAGRPVRSWVRAAGSSAGGGARTKPGRVAHQVRSSRSSAVSRR